MTKVVSWVRDLDSATFVATGLVMVFAGIFVDALGQYVMSGLILAVVGLAGAVYGIHKMIDE